MNNFLLALLIMNNVTMSNTCQEKLLTLHNKTMKAHSLWASHIALFKNKIKFKNTVIESVLSNASLK